MLKRIFEPLAQRIAGQLLRRGLLRMGHKEESNLRHEAQDLASCQQRVLLAVLARVQRAPMGQRFGLSKVKDIGEFRKYFDVKDYEFFRPFIEAHPQQLTTESPIAYAVTSGTTGAPKYVPVHESTAPRTQIIQRMFLYFLIRKRPRLLWGKVLSIVSPGVEGQMPASGTPFGSTSGHIYESAHPLLKMKYIVPACVFSIPDYDLKYQLILRLAAAAPDLTFVTTANPSSLLRLARLLSQSPETLIADLRTGGFSRWEELDAQVKQAVLPLLNKDQRRADFLKSTLHKKGLLTFADLWPQLQACSTWTGGSSAVFLDQLKDQWPERTLVSDLGYLATELRATMGIAEAHGCGLPAFRDHFFEFVERDAWEAGKKEFKLLHEIEDSHFYYVFVSTASGLLRYNMNDIVEVGGRWYGVPLLRFIQKGQGFTNITGEKLHEDQVLKSLRAAEDGFKIPFAFAFALADASKSCYEFYCEVLPERLKALREVREALGGFVDQDLAQRNREYEQKRLSGRLGAPRVVLLRCGFFEYYKKTLVAKGQREGQFKYVALQAKDKFPLDVSEWLAAE